MFISFEGIDGAGKTTQLRRLGAHLRAAGLGVVETREPGGSPGAEAIRGLLVEGAPGRWSPETEILLFTAARRDHVERTIRPALARGETVLSDRFVDSTRAYQGMARADLRNLVDRLHAQMIGIEPDLTLILDADPQTALHRGLDRRIAETRFEAMGLDFQIRLRAAYQALAAELPRCVLIDASGTSDAVAERIRAACAQEGLRGGVGKGDTGKGDTGKGGAGKGGARGGGRAG
ncbi:MAG: dTMP kinase [Pseudomonadota bacterium]